MIIKQFYTYLHCKPNGDPFYVGKGSNGRAHEFRRRNTHHAHVIAKYNKENILVYIFPCNSEEQAFKDEIQQISQLRLAGYTLVNYTNGGDGVRGYVRTESWYAKQRASHLGVHKNFSEEHKRNLSRAAKNKVFSIEHRLNLSIAATGRAGHAHAVEFKISLIARKDKKTGRFIKL